MTFWQFIQNHSGAVIAALVILYGAAVRALPAEASEFSWGQFLIDFFKGVGQQLPSNAPKLNNAQKAMLASPGK